MDINFSGNFMRNVGTNIIVLIVNVLIGLLLVPYFLDTLGPSAYALIPLATSVTSYITLIIDILNSATSRYLTIELQQGNLQKANETYSTAYTLLFAGVFVFLPIGFIVSFFAPQWFDTGTIANFEVTFFFLLIIGSVLISALRSNFMAILFSHNRLDLRNFVTIISTLTQIGLILLLFTILGPTLTNVGVAYCVAAVISLIVACLFAKKLRTGLHYSIRNYRREEAKELGKLTGYLLFDQLGVLIRTHTALIVINIYFGSVAETEYSLVVTWCTFLLSLSSVVISTISPKVYSLIGEENNTGALKFSALFTKITGLGMALPIAILCIFGAQLMTFWVGAEYAILLPLILILVPIRYFNVIVGCQVPLAIAHNKMRFPAFAGIFVGLLYLGMALLFPIIFNNGYYGVAIALVIITIGYHGITLPIYYSRISGGKWYHFLVCGIPGILAMLGLLVTGWLITTFANMVGIDINSVAFVIITALLISGIYLLLLWILILSTNEQMLILKCLPKRSRKYLKCFSLRDKL